MSSKESHRERRAARPRRRPERVAVEGLEPRQLLTYSPFGYSLPDLTVSGYGPQTAAWGGTLTIDVNVLNTGASSLVEPTHLAPGYLTTANTQGVSNANSQPTTVEVFASTTPNGRSGYIHLDSVAIPAISQNSNFETISTVPLPHRPAGFPGNGGKIFLTYVVNNTQAFSEANFSNNVYRVPGGLKISDPLPDLQVTAFNVPANLQPGDVISPTVRIANFGAGDPGAQAVVRVDLVASVNKTFGPGDAVVATYYINSIPGISGVPTAGSIADDSNVIPPPNTSTVVVPPFKLPTTPGFYYLGVVIDAFHTINQTYAPSPNLRDPVPVGPPSQYLPSGNLLFTTNGMVPLFPNFPTLITPPVVTTPTPVLTRPPLLPKSNNPIVTLDSAGKVTAKAAHVKPQKVSHPKARH